MFVAHALSSVDWAEIHEWLLLIFVIVGIVTAVTWVINFVVLVLAKIRERSIKKTDGISLALERIDIMQKKFEVERIKSELERTDIQDSLLQIREMIESNQK